MRIFDQFDNFVLSEPREYISVIESWPKNSRRVLNRGTVRQVDIYCLLHYRFGSPNGIQSFLRGDHSENLFHWHYSLMLGEIFIDILSSTRFLEFHIISSNCSILSGFNEQEFMKSLQSLLKNRRVEISREQKSMELWSLTLNTYKRLEDTTDYYFEQYSKIHYKEPVLSDHIATEREVKIYKHQLSKFIEQITNLKNFGLVLRMLYPVQSESLVNLLILMLAKPEIKSDARLLDNVFRSQIDIRVKTLHLNCDGLIAPYDQNDERYKNFVRMMGNRNDFLHGNVLPSKLRFDEVYFDGTVPLFLDDKDLSVEFAKQALFQVGKSEIENDNRTVREFKEYLIENLKVKIRNEVEILINKSQFGWNAKTGRLGVLFDDMLLTPIMTKK